MSAKNSDCRILREIRILTYHFLYSLNKIAHSLALICNALRNKENDTHIFRQSEMLTSRLLVLHLENESIYRVRNTYHKLISEESAFLRLRFKPTAARHKLNTAFPIHLILFLPHPCRQIII